MCINEDNIAASWYQSKLSSRFWSIWFTSLWLLPFNVSSPDHVERLGREIKKQPVLFKHKWQHAVRVNARCHKSATTLVEAQLSARWHKCDTPLPKVCCRSLNFRSRYTTRTRLCSRVNIVITWFNLKSLLRAGSVETAVQLVLIPRLPHQNMWVWGISWGLYMTAFVKSLK